MMDHDQRFKAMIRVFFAEFIELFFPEWANRYDVAHPEWQDKELFSNPPEGDRHLLDLVCRVNSREENSQVQILIHLEIESAEGTTSIKSRLPAYYTNLRKAYDLPVLPIVLFIKVGLDGIGFDSYEERIDDFLILQFNYLYIGLPALDGVKYLQSENVLSIALSALMKHPRDLAPQRSSEAVNLLGMASITEEQRFLLIECVEAYLPLDEQGRRIYNRIIENSPNNKVRAMHKTHYDLGLEQGELRALRTLAIAHLERKFRSVPNAILQRVEQMNKADLNDLTFQIPTASKLEDLFPNG